MNKIHSDVPSIRAFHSVNANAKSENPGSHQHDKSHNINVQMKRNTIILAHERCMDME